VLSVAGSRRRAHPGHRHAAQGAIAIVAATFASRLKEAATPLISIVVPVFNEEEVLDELYRRLAAAVGALGHDIEIVFVDDGSHDRSRDIIRALAAADPRVRGAFFSRNFGHEAAIHAGLHEAWGDAVIVMDADLQDSPEALPELIQAWERGADVVYAVRHDRKEGRVQRAAFSAYYRIAARVVDVELPVDAGPFSLMARPVVEAINSMSEHGRYFPGLRAFVGFHQAPVDVERAPRFAGTTKYSFRGRTSGAVHAIMSFSKLPLRLVSLLGFVAAIIAVVGATWVIIASVVSGAGAPGWVSLMTVVLLIAGVQLVTLGIVGEYVGKVYDEVRARPSFIVSERIGAGASAVDVSRLPRRAANGPSATRSQPEDAKR
jgi:polyisoprenyl-phosphate glycosyltransferase